MNESQAIKIIALSGSLRAASYNTALLKAVCELAPQGVDIFLYQELGNLPLFNPDLVAYDIPAVADFRKHVLASDGVIIASPEYAHGVTGVMKNALDWIVDGEEFVDKPVALLNASPRATHAQAALRETVSTMSAIIVDEASITLPILGSKLDKDGIANHEEMSHALRDAISVLVSAIKKRQQTLLAMK